MSNHLINESSPYLLQHANNPVDWYPWCQEAFAKAKAENKPILVSIGYSSCHWCHVMEHESFNDEQTAKLMNDLFVNIKVDREERPDLDAIYMDAVQAMTGSGGWPLNVFLTHDKKPFYGGTYFPPKPMYNRASWQDVLVSVHSFFLYKKEELNVQTTQLMQHLLQYTKGISPINEAEYTMQLAETLLENMLKNADNLDGGFGSAPKFPSCGNIYFLLQYYLFTKNEKALQQACLSLDKMAFGGIYDHIGGGFARYSTDKKWFAPHFEKMLYDNAQLLEVYALAYHITNNTDYAVICNQIVAYVKAEMMDTNGAFYTAQDADSEGVEGKYYVFTHQEITALLQQEAALFCKYFNVTENGNWEHQQNILHTNTTLKSFCKKENLEEGITIEYINQCKQKLKEYRAKRIAPFKDKKIILSWNALMSKCLIQAGLFLQNEEFINTAKKNIDFLLHHFYDATSNTLLRVSLDGNAKQHAVLEDYAYLSQVLIQVFIVTAEDKYLLLAKQLTDSVLENFSVENNKLFSNTSKNAKDIIVQKIDMYEHSMPNANAVMMNCLHYLGIAFQQPQYTLLHQQMQNAMTDMCKHHPNYFSGWAVGLMTKIFGEQELCIAAKNNLQEVFTFYKNYKPSVTLINTSGVSNIPYLKSKSVKENIMLYWCYNNTCFPPFERWEQLLDFGFMKE